MSSLAFVHLLILHPDASGKIYVMYGGAYVAAALAWLGVVDKNLFDSVGYGRRIDGATWGVDYHCSAKMSLGKLRQAKRDVKII